MGRGVWEGLGTVLSEEIIDRLIRSVGKGFFLDNIEYVYTHRTEDKDRLVAELFKKGNDSDISGTRIRLYAMLNIINEGNTADALKYFRVRSDLLRLIDQMHRGKSMSWSRDTRSSAS